MRASEVADRLTLADAAVWTSWLEAVRDRPTNPYGVTISGRGNWVALHCHAIPSRHFNRIMSLGAARSDDLDELLGFYAERFTPARVDLSPFGADGSLLEALVQRGLHPVELQSNLFVPLGLAEQKDPNPDVVEIDDASVSAFASMYERAYNYGKGTPSGIVAFRIASIRARLNRPEWRFFGLKVDGVLVAGGVLHLSDGVATLAGGATLPTHRRRGCQRALLEHRLSVAQDLGAELAVSRCAVGSVSQRNMEAIGMTTAYTKVILSQTAEGRRRPPEEPSRTRLLRAV